MGAELLLIYELTIETYALLGNKDKKFIYFSALKNFFVFSQKDELKVLPPLYLILEKLFNLFFSNENRSLIFSIFRELISIEKHKFSSIARKKRIFFHFIFSIITSFERYNIKLNHQH